MIKSSVGTINKKTKGLLSIAAHTGRTINKEDADFALMITHAIVNLVAHQFFER